MESKKALKILAVVFLICFALGAYFYIKYDLKMKSEARDRMEPVKEKTKKEKILDSLDDMKKRYGTTTPEEKQKIIESLGDMKKRYGTTTPEEKQKILDALNRMK